MHQNQDTKTQEQNEFERLCQDSLTSLNAVSDINEKMKQIVNNSHRLYIISLNAMFASRATNNGVSGFVEVTALLRDFSQRLDTEVATISKSIIALIYQSATMTKLKRSNQLLHQAIAKSTTNFQVPKHVSQKNQLLCDQINELSIQFTRQLTRCEMLMKLGENLAVLAKVEAVATEKNEYTLTPITEDMTQTINNIGKQILDSQVIIAA